MKPIKRITALFLAVIFIFSLAACGENGDAREGAGKLGDTVYLPEYHDLALPAGCTLTAACTDGEAVYVGASVYQEETETHTAAMYRIAATGGAEKLWSGAVPGESISGEVMSLCRGEDGGLWLAESRRTYDFDLPDGFDRERDSRWNYEYTSERTILLRRLDESGRELSQADVTAQIVEPDSNGVFSGSLAVDRSGACYVTRPGSLTVLDSSGSQLFALEDPLLTADQPPVRLADGGVAALCRSSTAGPQGAEDRYTLRAVDAEKQAWGDSWELPPVKAGFWFMAHDGGGAYRFCATADDTLYGLGPNEEAAEELLSWSASDVSSLGLEFCAFLSDGRLAVLVRSQNKSGLYYRLGLLTETDAASAPERVVLTYAADGMNDDDWARINDFNTSQSKYRIEATDYRALGDYENDDWSGYKLLVTEIVTGRIPDIIDVRDLPWRQFAAKGMLEDLWPYIDSDPELGRDRLMTHVLDCASVDGKLYSVFSQFAITTEVGLTETVGDRMSWTMEDLESVMDSMPERPAVFDATMSQQNCLLHFLRYNLGQYVDWSTGTCYFDRPEFRDALELCKGCVRKADYSATNRESFNLRNKTQLLYSIQLNEFNNVQFVKAVFGSDAISFVGFPMSSGGVGSQFVANGTDLAISTKCADKEGAWAFVRRMLLPGGANDSLGFSVNQADFEKMAAKQMGKHYSVNYEGSGIRTTLGPVTQEEYDQLMALYEAVEGFAETDYNIRTIVASQAAVYFAGDATLDETVQNIQSRAELYVNEQK